MMFGHAVNALLSHGLPQPIPENCLRRMRQLGVDPDLIQPAYPIELWVALLELLRDAYFGDDPPVEGYRELGRRVVNGFVQGPLGRAVAGSIRLAGPDRMLRSLSWVLRSASNFMETSIDALGAKHYRVILNTRVPDPGYNEGVLEAMLRQAGAEGIAVSPGEWLEDGRLAIEVRWAA
jgi:uncharacterized protein (TIGR02265 family)